MFKQLHIQNWRQFKDINTFMEEIESLMKKK